MLTGLGSRVPMWVSRRALAELGDVDRESHRGGAEKRDSVPHLAATGALSAHPRVLHDVVGVCRAFDDAIADTEEARADGLKRPGVRVGDLGVRAHVVARCDSTATSCRSM